MARTMPPRGIHASFLFLVKYSIMYCGFRALITVGSNLMKLKMPMPPMNANQIQIIGAKV